MHRVRTSLPYFKEFDWVASVVAVAPGYSDVIADELLLDSLPKGIEVHRVNAFDKKITSKIGFGSLGFRSFWHFRKKVNHILATEHYDLIYFSTTQFPVCALGPYWKKKFGVPYVIDMQDPWYSDHYENKPSNERPPKYRFVYGLHKILEARSMKMVSGLISVSELYIRDLKTRYPALVNVPSATITFGAFEPDLEIAFKNEGRFKPLLTPDRVNIVYVGRGGADMQKAIIPVFEALRRGLNEGPRVFDRLKFWFIGTSYAPKGQGKQTILPLAKAYEVEQMVVEMTDRISYYHALNLLKQADALFIPGSDDPKYSASKIFPYLLMQKPLLAVFNERSNAVTVLRECAVNTGIFTFGKGTAAPVDDIYRILRDWADRIFTPVQLPDAFEEYSARKLTYKQTLLFDQAVRYHEEKNTDA